MEHRVPAHDKRLRPVCTRCGEVVYRGPTLLTTVMVVAQEHLLLVKRGTQPYINKWAPPGGFVEEGESLEQGAMREVEEEAGLELSLERLHSCDVLSLPEINQVYVSFVAFLDRPQPLRARAPETLEARWFSERDFPGSEVWEPARDFDLARFLDCAGALRCDRRVHAK